MGFVVVRHSERPELWEGIDALSSEVWPEYNLHGEVLGAYWRRLYEEFADFQFVLYERRGAGGHRRGSHDPVRLGRDAEGLG